MEVRESDIEQGLIKLLQYQNYTYRPDIRDKAALDQNFREKFQALNRVTLTDSEYDRLKTDIISSDVYEAADRLRKINHFEREDGTPLNYTLVNIDNWCKNEFEVINQLRINTENSHHRYDVIILINGIPVVQIELKTLQTSPRRAMAQIVDYKNDLGNGYANTLLCFMQLFIVSNQSQTFYFANNRNEHFSFNADEQFLPVYEHADENNKKISHLDDFTRSFLGKCTLGQMLSRYMVLVANEHKMMVMRPYQIYAVKAIVDAIEQNRGNGYIWHTTGSGKTLTSFKASTLLKGNPDVDKCLFVVDRKDLDRQTREEFNTFQKGCVEQNTNTEMLVRRLLSEDYKDKVIVTTIQKLGLALDENIKRNAFNKNKAKAKQGKESYRDRLAPLRDKRMVFIFDECHRSQFGENHQAIKNFFPNAQLFGFTGTPIFDENATYQTIENETKTNKTTEDVFQHELHRYTITNAIEDRNVLGFHIDYLGEKVGLSNESESKKTKTKKNPSPPPLAVAKEILAKHEQASDYRRFNAVFATSSINKAIEYVDLFKQLQAQKLTEDPAYKPFNVACVFSPPAQLAKKDADNGDASTSKQNQKDIEQLQEDLTQEQKDNLEEPEKKKAALMSIINDYNQQYDTNHSINEFDDYYQDVQQRIKDQKYPNSDYAHQNKIDIMIVVDMLLTGFDSKYLNTLYVDKNLKWHSLIQAFSRTNRVLDDTKPHGNILDFRAQKDRVDEAIAKFSGESDESKAQSVWLVDPAPQVIEKLDKAVTELQDFMQNQGVSFAPEDVRNLKGDKARAEFVNKFKEVQRISTQLGQYTDIDEDNQQTIEAILSSNTQRAFKAQYLETASRLKSLQDQQRNHADGDVQQLDFEFALFASAQIDYDYIMELLANSTQKSSASGKKEKMTRQQIIDWILADAKFLAGSGSTQVERDDIIAYINSLPTDQVLTKREIEEGLQAFINNKNSVELTAMATKHGLALEALQNFVDKIVSRKVFDGEKLTDLMEPLELGWLERRDREEALMAELIPLLKKLVEGREISGLSVYES